MSLKINELNCDGEELYSIDYLKDFKNRFERYENGANTIINIFCIECEEHLEVYKNLGFELFYCQFNELYYIKANEKNMKIFVDLLEKYNIEITSFDILYSKYEEAYISKIEIFINEKNMLKYDTQKDSIFVVIKEELKKLYINIELFNETYFICKSSNINFGLFDINNLNILINDIITKINHKLIENEINFCIKFKSVDIKTIDNIKYINKLLFNFNLLKK